MTDPAREDLAARQAALLRALVGGGAVPDGFDPTRVRAQERALRDKRRRVVAALRADLPGVLGDRFPALFEEYARAHPRRTGTGAREDADAFAGWLAERGEAVHPVPRRRRWRWRRQG